MSTDIPPQSSESGPDGAAHDAPPLFPASPSAFAERDLLAEQGIRVDESGRPPLWAPWYGIGFADAYGRFWRKYSTFSGRASRSEYWWVVLTNALIVIVTIALAIILSVIAGPQPAGSTGSSSPGLAAIPISFFYLYQLATIVPNLALTARRLHDANLTGWLVVALYVPLVNVVAFIIIGTLESHPEGARFDRPTA